MKLYNTLTRKLEEFKPIKKGQVGIYSCGPTVYDHAHIGHFRSYTFVDTLRRVLLYNGFKVKHVMNLTDVGHLTEYDVEEQMKKRDKDKGTVWEIAEFYAREFFEAMEKLNVLRPDIICKASEHINKQIELIRRLEKEGYTYKIDDGVYYDISKFPVYGKLGKLRLDGQEPGARVDVNSQKKSLYDFALWKFSKPEEHRAMEWDSPWGKGVPGWHIECSAMSMKYLGENFDIHTGGEDLISIHHTNEIAQTEAVTGRKFVNYWIHNAHLMVEGERMSRSKGNFYTMDDILKRGFEPLSIRYLCLTVHYRQKMNFTWRGLEGAQKALDRLRDFTSGGKESGEDTSGVTRRGSPEVEEYKKRFLAAINDDLNMPQALAVVWEMIKDKRLKIKDKRELILDWDRVLGLGLARFTVHSSQFTVNKEVKDLIEEREKLRKAGKWEEADKIRKKVEELGWKIEDMAEESKLRKICS